MGDRIWIFYFSSSYFEGKNAGFAEPEYSKDHRSGKKQATEGISTGINSIPTALTIQRGNAQDNAYERDAQDLH